MKNSPEVCTLDYFIVEFVKDKIRAAAAAGLVVAMLLLLALPSAYIYYMLGLLAGIINFTALSGVQWIIVSRRFGRGKVLQIMFFIFRYLFITWIVLNFKICSPVYIFIFFAGVLTTNFTAALSSTGVKTKGRC